MGKHRKKLVARYWAWGERTRLAQRAGTTRSRVSLIFSRQVRPGFDLAMRLSDAAATLRKKLPVEEILNNTTSRHPAFSGKPSRR